MNASIGPARSLHYAKAEALVGRALAIVGKAMGPEHPTLLRRKGGGLFERLSDDVRPQQQPCGTSGGQGRLVLIEPRAFLLVVA